MMHSFVERLPYRFVEVIARAIHPARGSGSYRAVSSVNPVGRKRHKACLGHGLEQQYSAQGAHRLRNSGMVGHPDAVD
jgi:hypothetical protein